MSLKGKYSPPYSVKMIDGETTLTFTRMLADEWEGLAEIVKSERVDAENAKINTEMAKDSAPDRAEARMRMRDFMEEVATMSRVIRESANSPKGIRRLLKFALVEKANSEWLDVLSPTDINDIVNQIVYLPVVKPPDPQKLPPQSEASSGGSESSESSPTGQNTPATSNPSSTDMMPVA